MSFSFVRCWLVAVILALPGPVLPEEGTGIGVHLSRERQQLAGIRIQVLPAPQPMPSEPAWAYTLDPAPLLEAAAEYRRLRQSRRNASETVRVLEERYRRLKRLGTGVRHREREQAELAWLEARNRLQTLTVRLDALKQRLTSRWGIALTQWLWQRPDRLQALAAGTITLVRLVPDEAGPAWLIYQRQRIPLHYLSPLPGADPRLAMPAALFWARAAVPHGLRLPALSGETASAVPVPAAAVVWYAGRPWVYLQRDDETFRRHPLENWRATGDTWWVREALAGRRIVVRGAQLLLAEEFRAQVPEEDDD